jgi:putative ABC transport system permease protein
MGMGINLRVSDSGMVSYYLDLGRRSLVRSPLLTALIVVLIGTGVASSMVTFAAFRAMSADPMPGKSAQLYEPQIDNWGPLNPDANGEPPLALSYIDAKTLLHAHAAPRQTALYQVAFSLVPEAATVAPFAAKGYAVTANFFAMFDVPFVYGAGWSAADDDKGTDAVVISRRLNDRLFGGVDSVGREVRLDDHDYRVVGVAGDWNPQPRFYATGHLHDNIDQGDAPDVFLPFTYAVDHQVANAWGNYCNADYSGNGWAALLHSECVWVAFWVDLPTQADARAYAIFLRNYAAEQQRVGRFSWQPNVRLRSLAQSLDYQHAVPEETRVSFLLALGLQLVCLVNVIGLLLAKFMRRSAEIGVRRALGASRGAIGLQFLTEAALVGVVGGLLGLLLTGIGIYGMGAFFTPKIARLVHIDVGLFGLTLLVSIVATVFAALYPIWRATQVQPAWQLKSN